jgi:hypothetical protein
MNFQTIRLKTNNQGFVSIVVTMLVAVILSLIAIGFSNVMSRQQKDTLERQLSTQALYAAESGVNDAIQKLATNPSFQTPGTDCKKVSEGGLATNSAGIAGDSSVKSTCVTIEQAQKVLVNDTVTADPSRPWVIPLIPISSTPIERLQVSWEPGPDSSLPIVPAGSTPGTFTDYVSKLNVIKATLVLFTAGNSRDQLSDATRTYYLYPTGTSIPTPLTDPNTNAIISGACSGSKCSISIPSVQALIAGLTAGRPDVRPYLILSPLYRTNKVEISAYDSSSSSIELGGVQVSIDSTGRVNDTTRRVRVYKPIINEYQFAPSALGSPASSGICKEISAFPAPAGVPSVRELDCNRP